MSKLQELKIKKYAKMKEKYPNAEYIYRTYKINNLNFHESHKTISWFFLSKLIKADKVKKDLTKIPFPLYPLKPLSHSHLFIVGLWHIMASDMFINSISFLTEFLFLRKHSKSCIIVITSAFLK